MDIDWRIVNTTVALFNLYPSLKGLAIRQFYLLGKFDGIITDYEYDQAESAYGRFWRIYLGYPTAKPHVLR
jgi:hypothetical protein